MDTTISTNILFIVLSAFLILLLVGFAFVALFFVLLLGAIRKELKKISQDVENFRGKIKNGEAALTSFVLYILSFFRRDRLQK